MPAVSLRSAFPSGPLIDPTTQIMSSAWQQFFLSLYTRTGQANGVSTADLTQSLAAETSERQAADAQLSGQIATETTQRGDAIAAETAARTAGDAALEASKLALAGGTLTGPLTGTTGTFATLAVTGGAGATWTSGPAFPDSSNVQPAGSIYSCTGPSPRLWIAGPSGQWNAIQGS